MSQKKCVASNCGAVFHTFRFPKADGLRQKWVQFVVERKPDYQFRVTHRLCFRHFHTEHFSNYGEYQESYVNRLLLNGEDMNPIPTVQIPEHGFSALSPRQIIQQQRSSQFTLSTRKMIVLTAQIEASEGPVTPRSRRRVASPQPETELVQTSVTPMRRQRVVPTSPQLETELPGTTDDLNLDAESRPMFQNPDESTPILESGLHMTTSTMETQSLSTDIIVPALETVNHYDPVMVSALTSRPVVRLQRMAIDLYPSNFSPPACIKDEPVDVLDTHIHTHQDHDVVLHTDMSTVDMKPTDVEIEVPIQSHMPECSIDSRLPGDRLPRCNQYDLSRGRKSPLTLHSVGGCTGEKPHKCDLCDYRTAQRGDLTKHMRTHTGDKPYICDLCDFRTAQKSNLESHLRTHTGDKPYKCDLCDYRTVRKGFLATHIRTHTGEKPYKCDLCNYRTAHKGDLTTHVRTHTGEKPYKCNLCDFQTAHKVALRRHKAVKPYKCDMCDYRSAHKGDFKHHVRTHTGEKPYECDLCDYRTGKKSHLTRHMRTHTGQKPYKCDQCDYQTTQKSNLESHMRSHTGDKPYKCDLCDYRTALNGVLARHIRTHTGDKPHQCHHCDFRTAHNSALARHIRTHTGD